MKSSYLRIAGRSLIGRMNNPNLNPTKTFAIGFLPLIVVVVALPAAAHPGPEPHPTVPELEEVVSEIRLAIDEVDRRLGGRIGDLETLVRKSDKPVVVEEAIAEPAQSSNEQEDWVDKVVTVGAPVSAVVLAGVSGFLGFRVRTLNGQLSNLLQPASEAQGAHATPTNTKEQPATQETSRKQKEEKTADEKLEYCVNKKINTNRHHEIHNYGCRRLPKPENRKQLGRFDNCQSAVNEARKHYTHVDGCGLCSPDCNKVKT